MVTGHFTTMQVRGGAVQALDLHLARLRDAQRELSAGAFEEHALRARIRDALAGPQGGADAGLRAGDAGPDCTLRIVCRVGGEPVIETAPPREPADAPIRVRSHRGLRVAPHIKHLDIEAQVEARRTALDAGCDDALLVDSDGRIAEGTFWNLALLEGGAILWPEAPMLVGVTQRRLQAALERAGIPQRREVVRLDRLAAMRAAFALNSRGLQEIAAIDGHALQGDRAMADRLRGLLAGDPWQFP